MKVVGELQEMAPPFTHPPVQLQLVNEELKRVRLSLLYSERTPPLKSEEQSVKVQVVNVEEVTKTF